MDGASQMALVVKNPTANARDARDTGLIPRLGLSPGGGQGNPLQYSCLRNPKFIVSQRVRYDWSDLPHLRTHGHLDTACAGRGFLWTALICLPRDRSSKKNSTAINPLLGNFIYQGRLTHLMRKETKSRHHTQLYFVINYTDSHLFF